MQIGIDLRYMRPGQVGGTEVYVRGLLAALDCPDQEHHFLLFTNQDNAGSFGLEGSTHFSETGDWRLSARQDVLLFPGTTMIPLRTPVRKVVVVHDIQHKVFPQHFSLRERFRRWRRDRPSIKAADCVISVSEFTRRAVLDAYRISPEKVQVVYQGVAEAFFHSPAPDALAEVKGRYKLPQCFLFYPARFWPHKNHANLYEALRILREGRHPQLELVLCGEANQQPLPEYVTCLGLIPYEDLPLLYRAAAALVFPSLYEGFGLPLLEAMASGCPVACARAGSLPEVGGDAAHYFDPGRPKDIAAALHRLLHEGELRAGLVKTGLNRARGYSWDRCARQTLEVLAGKGTTGLA